MVLKTMGMHGPQGELERTRVEGEGRDNSEGGQGGVSEGRQEKEGEEYVKEKEAITH